MQWLIDILFDRVMQNLTGIIVAWSGSIATIPVGWALCDGTQGTPDLTARFIFGGGVTPVPGTSGGSVEHNHSFTSNLHYHSVFKEKKGEFDIGIYGALTSSTAVTGTTENGENIPPYYVLAYIMKL